MGVCFLGLQVTSSCWAFGGIITHQPTHKDTKLSFQLPKMSKKDVPAAEARSLLGAGWSQCVAPHAIDYEKSRPANLSESADLSE